MQKNLVADEKLVQIAIEMQTKSYAPYSHFTVGAALLCSDGTIITGCNVENAAYGSTICAERTALCKAISEGHRDFVAIAIAGQSEDFCWPCGACRQMLYEFAPGLRVLAAGKSGKFQERRLDELLPCGFGATHLG